MAPLRHVLVAGDVDLTGFLDAALPTLDLIAVGGSLFVREDHIDGLSLPALTFVGGVLSIMDNPTLQQVDLPSLARATGLVIVNQPLLVTLDLQSLRRVTGTVDVRANGTSGGTVLALYAAALQRVDGSLTVRDNPSLPENRVQGLVIQLEETGQVGGLVDVGNNGPPEPGG